MEVAAQIGKKTEQQIALHKAGKKKNIKENTTLEIISKPTFLLMNVPNKNINIYAL